MVRGPMVVVFLGGVSRCCMDNGETPVFRDALTSAVDCSREAVRPIPSELGRGVRVAFSAWRNESSCRASNTSQFNTLHPRTYQHPPYRRHHVPQQL